MTTQHTPTPWYVGKDYYGGVSIRTKPEDAHNIIGEDAIFEDTGRAAGEMLSEDAEFIVRACNSYDDLLAACKAALLWIQRPSDQSEILPTLRAAIAKATGGTP